MSIAHASSAPAEAKDNHARAGFWTLTLGSVGVVYGDIGTSPLYALKESLTAAAAGGALTREMVLGVMSLMLWALIVVVTLKYVLLIMRADNNGEGGTLALMALLQRVMGRNVFAVTLFGMAGAALFYGDAIITPAISVLSAVEGLKLATPAFEPFVIPLSLAILVGLFSVQSRGTAAVAAWFGPITAIWFVALAAGGLIHLVDDPSILAALSPIYGVRFLLGHGHVGLVALGAVFLTVTGAEALYADMGHFGRRPIQTAWLAFVLPSLAINYLGQGALLLETPGEAREPVLPALSRLGAPADGGAGDGGDDHREPGGHHRRLLADPAGDPARPPAAHGDPPHLGDREGADLHPAGELAAAHRRRLSRDRVPLVERVRLGLRHRRHRHDGDHDRDGFPRHVEVLALAPGDGGARHRALPRHRPRLPGGEHAEDRRGRLDAARRRRRADDR